MADWVNYSLADLVPFTRGTYLRLFELYNARAWPAAAIGQGFGIWMLWLLWRPDAGRIRACLGALGVCWVWIGWAFHLDA